MFPRKTTKVTPKNPSKNTRSPQPTDHPLFQEDYGHQCRGERDQSKDQGGVGSGGLFQSEGETGMVAHHSKQDRSGQVMPLVPLWELAIGFGVAGMGRAPVPPL